MKRYGYHRTSTREQHLDRPRYTIMKEDVLRTGDELSVTEGDRLGRFDFNIGAGRTVRRSWIGPFDFDMY